MRFLESVLIALYTYAKLEQCNNAPLPYDKPRTTVRHAEIYFQPRAVAKQQATTIDAADMENPELFQALKAWWTKQTSKEDVEPYRILHQRILIQTATVLPDTLDPLANTDGTYPYSNRGKKRRQKNKLLALFVRQEQ